MGAKIGINGFGRIGRNVLRAAVDSGSDLEFVGINDITQPRTLAHLLKYDSIYGRMPGEVGSDENGLTLDGRNIRVFSERDPGQIPWHRPVPGERFRP